MTSENAFTAFAETISPPRKSRRKDIGARETKRREKTLQERDRLSRAYQRWRKETVAALLDGPHGADGRVLGDFLEHMDLELSSATALIKLVRSGPWRNADRDTRFLVLVLIDTAIIRLREHAGLHPFDDPLAEEKSNVFLTLRELLQ
jgi:hypothetical protein